MSGIRVRCEHQVQIVTIDRPETRNAVDRPTAAALADAFRAFEADPSLSVAVLTGAGGTFCSGADLEAIANEPERANRVEEDGDAPMGPTRMCMSKPVIAAIEGHAVAGGMELALWCDLRVVARTAAFGLYNRRWGIPTIDGGTVRLPRLIGHSRAMDLILTGRTVGAAEAFDIGLANRLCEPGKALEEAVALARDLARFPQDVLRGDRLSAMAGWGHTGPDALVAEFHRGIRAEGHDTTSGAARFVAGKGRHGDFVDI